MFIDIKKQKRTGEPIQNFSFEFAPLDSLLPFEDLKFDGKAKIEGEVELDENAVWVCGKFSATLRGFCALCQNPCKQPFEMEFEEKFVQSNSDEFYSYSKDIIDLSQLINDLILSNAPLCIYCKEDCKGLCPVCGCDLNERECDCKKN